VAQIVALHGASGPISDIRIVDRQDINRNWTWVAVGKSGIQYREVEYRSIANLPKDADITRLTLHVTGVPPEKSPEFGLMIPPFAQPLAFSRHERVGADGVQGGILTVIGYRDDEGNTLYLWVTESGDALVTREDLSEYD